jgi:hypothetical protein
MESQIAFVGEPYLLGLAAASDRSRLVPARSGFWLFDGVFRAAVFRPRSCSMLSALFQRLTAVGSTNPLSSRRGGRAAGSHRVQPRLECLDDRVLPSTIYASYPGQGLFRWQDGTWQQPDIETPALIASANSSEVFGAYGNSYSEHGLWRWSLSQGWQRLDTEVPYLIATGSYGEVFAAYGNSYSDHGLWRWTVSNGWQQVGTEDPVQIAVPRGSSGEVFGVYDNSYSDHGLWRWSISNGWQQLGTAVPYQIATGWTGEVFGAYSGIYSDPGLWRWTVSDGWQQVGTAQPDFIATSALGEVFGAYGEIDSDPGLWRWSISDSWQQLSTEDPYQIATGSFGEVFWAFGGFFDSHGLWRWSVSDGVQEVGTEDPYLIAAGSYGEVFGAYDYSYSDHGLWRWSTSDSWQQLGTDLPYAVVYAPEDPGGPQGGGASGQTPGRGTPAPEGHDPGFRTAMPIRTPPSAAIPTETPGRAPDLRPVDALFAASVPREQDLAPPFPKRHWRPAFGAAWPLLLQIDRWDTDGVFSTLWVN